MSVSDLPAFITDEQLDQFGKYLDEFKEGGLDITKLEPVIERIARLNPDIAQIFGVLSIQLVTQLAAMEVYRQEIIDLKNSQDKILTMLKKWAGRLRK